MLQVLGNQRIEQNDELIPAGAELILALESSPAHSNRGIYWCLSLSHLRYDPLYFATSVEDCIDMCELG